MPWFRLTDVILVWVVECVDDRRLGRPFVLVHRLPELVHVLLGLEAEDVEEVLQEATATNGQLVKQKSEKKLADVGMNRRTFSTYVCVFLFQPGSIRDVLWISDPLIHAVSLVFGHQPLERGHVFPSMSNYL